MRYIILLSLFLGQNLWAKLPPESELARTQKVMLATAELSKLVKKILNPNGPRRGVSAFIEDNTTDVLLKAANQPDCKIIIRKPEEKSTDSSSGIKTGGADIVGDKCSLNLFLDTKLVKQSEERGEYNFAFKYTSKSEELKKLIDVDKFDLVGPGFVNVIKSENGMNADIEMTFGGVLHSQTEGDVNLSMKLGQKVSLTVDNGQMNMYMKMLLPMNIKFKDFEIQTLAEVEIANNQKVEKFTINGEAVTKEVYDAITGKFSIPGAETEE